MSGSDFADQGTRTMVTGRRPPVVSQTLRVTVLRGPDTGHEATDVVQPLAVLGRGQGADVRLTDPTVSSFHAELRAQTDGVEVRDLGSRNGIRHAGARILHAIVPSGALLELADTVVRVEVGAPVERPASDALSFGELRGNSSAMRDLFALLARVAPSDLAVLIEGPTGTGKELAARAVHDASRANKGPFVVLDCTAIPSSLAESVLFGHEKGAFTGASERREGVFEAADGGTVFLDEVGELPAELQPKLLRVLERREVVRVGATRPVPVRVRVLAATWRDLRSMINDGRFREDLYYRLAQARVVIPPLRERPEDIPALVHHFLQRIAPDAPGARSITPEALDELALREYRGNVRELRSTVERASMVAATAVITPTDLAFERMLAGEHAGSTRTPRPTRPPGDPLEPYKQAKRTLVDEFERDYLARLLARTGTNLSRASSVAGIDRHRLRDLLRKHGLRADDAG